MMGPWYTQLMKARLGVGKPMEGYGGFAPPQSGANGMAPQGLIPGASLPVPTPMHPAGSATLPSPTPWGQAELPHERPWMQQKGYDSGASLPEPSPWGQAGMPQENPYKPQKSSGDNAGSIGGYKNPWQRF